jgi:hypothetical protein
MVPSLQTSLPSAMPVVVRPRENPQSTSSDSQSPIGAIAGGIAGGVVIGLLVLGFILYRKRSDTANHDPKPSNATNEETTARIGSINGHEPSTPSNTGHPVAAAYGATLSSVESGQSTPAQSHQAANVSSMVPDTMPAQPQYDVNYKDQARTVIGQPQPMPTVEGVPVQTHIPIAVAMDVSNASGGSNTTRSEPPGRRMQEP